MLHSVMGELLIADGNDGVVMMILLSRRRWAEGQPALAAAMRPSVSTLS